MAGSTPSGSSEDYVGFRHAKLDDRRQLQLAHDEGPGRELPVVTTIGASCQTPWPR